MSTRSNGKGIVQNVQLAIVIGALFWVGSNVFSALFGGDPCEKAQAWLQTAEDKEQELRDQASSDGYRFTNGALEPLNRATRTRMYAQQDVNKACNP